MIRNDPYLSKTIQKARARVGADAAVTTTQGGPPGGGDTPPVYISELRAMYNAGDLEVKWHVPRLVPKKSLVLLGGSAKSGKTVFMTHLVAAVVSGKEFMGLQTSKCKVLWLGLDEGRLQMVRRFVEVGISEGLYLKERPFKTNRLQLLEQWINELGIGLVVVDTLSKWWTVKDENEARETDMTFEEVRTVSERTGATIVLLHHFNKSAQRSNAEIRGSTTISANMDANILLRKNPDGARELYFEGRVYDQEFKIQIKKTEEGFTLLGEVPLMPEARKEARQSVLLQTMPVDQKQTAKQVSMLVNQPLSTVKRALDELEQAGKIKAEGGGGKYNPKKYWRPSPPPIEGKNGGGDGADS